MVKIFSSKLLPEPIFIYQHIHQMQALDLINMTFFETTQTTRWLIINFPTNSDYRIIFRTFYTFFMHRIQHFLSWFMVVEIKSLPDVLTLLNKHRKSRLQKPRRKTKPLLRKICPHKPSSLERKLNFPPPLPDRAEHPKKKTISLPGLAQFRQTCQLPTGP